MVEGPGARRREQEEAPKALVFKVYKNDRLYELDINDVTGLEARAYRQATGFGLQAALVMATQGHYDDLEWAAGIVWLVRRRNEPKLAYEEVLEDFSYADLRASEQRQRDEVPKGEEDFPPDGGGSS